ncbi:MAG: hypothetical protein M1839_006583 [Geoglossum umbratile]|nr:MAG: hypothetical protein M1839_006583 [Geoglossum umbratile]
MDPSPGGRLCNFCSEITLESLFDHDHQPSLEALQQSAETCPLCQLISEAIEPGLNTVRIELGQISPRDANLPISLQGQATQEVLNTAKQWRWQNVQISMTKTTFKVALGEISPYVEDDDPLAIARHILGRRVSGSEQTLQLARSFISRCTTMHSECWRESTEDPSQLPKWVIDVYPSGSKSHVRLHDSVVRSGEYVCLSHCWGKIDLVKTTLENKEKMKAGIPLDALPKTYRDAIDIARRLSVRYIWIDSLCILQGPDPNPDWEEESAKMGAIFQNALFTIAAAASENSLGGCHTARKPPTRVVPIRCQFDEDRLTGTIYFQPAFQNWSNILLGPLDKRAWTLQERILSTRILHFGADQMLMECNRGITGENGHQYEHANHPRRLPLLSHFVSAYASAQIEEPKWRLQRSWSRTVADFTARNLTYETDKLPAIAGLANEIQRLTGDRYFMGLWESCLNRQLLWYGVGLSKPLVHRAPSWSWAALNGMAKYPVALTLRAWEEHESAVELLGVPASGRLRLAGKLTAVTMLSGITKRAGGADIHDLVAGDQQTVGWAILDIPRSLPLACQVLLASTHSALKLNERSVNAWNVLLLDGNTTGAGSDYVRIGIGLVNAGIFADAPVNEVHIV